MSSWEPIVEDCGDDFPFVVAVVVDVGVVVAVVFGVVGRVDPLVVGSLL